MRQLDIGSDRFTKVVVTDEPGKGNACHKYEIIGTEIPEEFAWIEFQNGPVKENGVNGCHQEDLLAIVIDRLQCFQAGKFACEENQEALNHLERAMVWLNHRTEKRRERGVEGTSIK